MSEVAFQQVKKFKDLDKEDLAYLRSNVSIDLNPWDHGFTAGYETSTNLTQGVRDLFNYATSYLPNQKRINKQQAKEQYGLDIEDDEISESWAQYKSERKKHNEFYSQVINNMQDKDWSTVAPFMGGIWNNVLDPVAWASMGTLRALPFMQKASKAVEGMFKAGSYKSAIAGGLVYDLSEETLSQLVTFSAENVTLDRNPEISDILIGYGASSALSVGVSSFGHWLNLKSKPKEMAVDEIAYTQELARSGVKPKENVVTDLYKYRASEGVTIGNLNEADIPSHLFYSVHKSIDGSISAMNQVTPFNRMGTRGFQLMADPRVAQNIATNYQGDYTVARISLADANIFSANNPLSDDLTTLLMNLFEEEFGSLSKQWLGSGVNDKALKLIQSTERSLYDIFEAVAMLDKQNPDMKLFDKVHDVFQSQGYDGYYFGNRGLPFEKTEIPQNSVYMFNESKQTHIDSYQKRLKQDLPELEQTTPLLTDRSGDIILGDGKPKFLEYTKNKIRELEDYYNSAESSIYYNQRDFEDIESAFREVDFVDEDELVDLKRVTESLKSKEEEVEYLQGVINDAKKFEEDISTELDTLTTQRKDMQESIKGKKSQLKELRKVRNANKKTGRVDDTTDAKIQKLETELEELTSTVDDSVGRIEALTTTKKAIQSEVNPRKIILRSIQKDIEKIREPMNNPDRVRELAKSAVFCRR